MRWSTLLLAMMMACLLLGTGRTDAYQTPIEETKSRVKDAPEGVKPLPRLPKNNDIEWDHISLEDGLSQSTVTCIVQDKQGFIWFGTWDGLNRYDGYRFTVFKHDPEDPHSLSENMIWTLFEDRAGNLWVGTDGGGLDRFDRETEQFIHYRHNPAEADSLSSDYVKSIYEDQVGVLWVGTFNGLNRLERESGRFTLFRNSIDPPEQLYGSNYVTDIYQDRGGTLWIGTLGGLLTFNRRSESFIHYNISRNIPRGNAITVINGEQPGILWVGTDGGGLHAFDIQTRTATHHIHSLNDPGSLLNDNIQDLVVDPQGTLWVGTAEGLDRLDLEMGHFVHYRNDPQAPDSLSQSSIESLYVDEAGVLWVGTSLGGINKFDRHQFKFTQYQADQDDPLHSLGYPAVAALFQDSAGNLWIGTDGGGLDRLNRRTNRFSHYRLDPADPNSLSSDTVTAIYEDQAGVLWIGTHGGTGLQTLDPDSGLFTRYPLDPAGIYGLTVPAVTAIFEDSTGLFWIATNVGGLFTLDRASGLFAQYLHQEDNRAPDTLGLNYVRSICEDRSGTLWFGTLGGLMQYDRKNESFGIYQHDPNDPFSLSHNAATVVLEDQQENLWVGTNLGLDRLDRETGAFFHFTDKDGLPNNTIVGILEDSQGNLWISTNRGLARFNPRSAAFKNFTTSDGLQSLEFSSARHKSSSGEMFFGGINGFNSFFPEEIQENLYIPPIVITDFTILNQSVPFGDGAPLEKPIAQTGVILLSRRDTVFSFELAALHYSAPAANQYAYRMDPFDEDWNKIGTRRFATYTNLPPGRYLFRAIGTNSDGVWNMEGTTIEIIMPPPIWQRTWFIAGTVLLLIGGVWGIYRWRVTTVEARNRELASQVRERTYEIERRRQLAEGLREILIILNSDRSLKESLDYIASQAARLTKASEALIFEQNSPETSTTIISSSQDDPPEKNATLQLILSGEWIETSILRGDPLVITDLAGPGGARHNRAILGVPLMVGEVIFGGLVLFYTEARSFSKEDMDLALTLADQATLAIANAQLRDRVEQTAVTGERNRLARDLHDAVTQTLFSASLIAEALPEMWDSDQSEGRQLLAELRQLTRGALAEMRTLLLELRPAALAETKLADLLRQLSEAVSGRTGVPVKIETDDHCLPPPEVHVALYRIAQEALNNIVKHARASQIEVSLHCRPSEERPENGAITLRVKDNGRGFDPHQIPPDRLGLNIIQERSQDVGAHLSIESCPGQGTAVNVRWDFHADFEGEEG